MKAIYNKIFVGVFVGITLTWANVASAESINLTVPVRLSNLAPGAYRVFVSCAIIIPGRPGIPPNRRLNLSITSDAPSVSGTAQFALSGFSISEVREFVCTAELRQPNGSLVNEADLAPSTRKRVTKNNFGPLPTPKSIGRSVPGLR